MLQYCEDNPFSFMLITIGTPPSESHRTFAIAIHSFPTFLTTDVHCAFTENGQSLAADAKTLTNAGTQLLAISIIIFQAVRIFVSRSGTQYRDKTNS